MASTSSEGDEVRGGGELVGVAFARDAIEAELIKGLLENAGIPSLLQQVGLNVDGPQLGFGLLPRGFGGGPQRVMVHAEQAESAHALLAETLVENEAEVWPGIANAEDLGNARGREPRNYGLIGAYVRVYLWSFGVFAVAFAVFLLFRAA
jgi:Putative prokaryotic signal transducing protein